MGLGTKLKTSSQNGGCIKDSTIALTLWAPPLTELCYFCPTFKDPRSYNGYKPKLTKQPNTFDKMDPKVSIMSEYGTI